MGCMLCKSATFAFRLAFHVVVDLRDCLELLLLSGMSEVVWQAHGGASRNERHSGHHLADTSSTFRDSWQPHIYLIHLIASLLDQRRIPNNTNAPAMPPA